MPNRFARAPGRARRSGGSSASRLPGRSAETQDCVVARPQALSPDALTVHRLDQVYVDITQPVALSTETLQVADWPPTLVGQLRAGARGIGVP